MCGRVWGVFVGVSLCCLWGVWGGFGGVCLCCVCDSLVWVWGSEFVLCVGQFGAGFGE